jgi:hypothetical protein
MNRQFGRQTALLCERRRRGVQNHATGSSLGGRATNAFQLTGRHRAGIKGDASSLSATAPSGQFMDDRAPAWFNGGSSGRRNVAILQQRDIMATRFTTTQGA